MFLFLDCETCYTLFSSSLTPSRNRQTTQEIRDDIFEFQQELDKTTTLTLNGNTTSSSNKTPRQKRFDIDDSDRLMMDELYPLQKKDKKLAHKSKSTNTFFFDTPKPVRPQLHAFI